MSVRKEIISENELKQLVKSIGSGIVTNRIVYDGLKVGFMYRSEPEFEFDSGWRFLAGDETDEYLADGDNSKVMDINTVANYDPAIVPYVHKRIGTELERVEGTNEFVPIEEE